MSTDHSRYFDANATTPLCPAARDAWLQASSGHWHNPSSLYREAGAASRLLEDAREELADHFDTEAGRIVFNSGATEANNAVLQWMASTLPPQARIALSAVEHPCVTDTAERLFSGERRVTLAVTADGGADLDAVETLFKKEPAPGFVSLMAANNETGVLQPWREVAALCRERGIPFHCDAAQWIGKLSPDGLAGCDYVTASAHKFGGPKGAGFLIVPEEFKDSGHFRGQMGGPQEQGRRGGTENLPSILAMLAALKEFRREDPAAQPRDQFEARLEERVKGVRILGKNAERLWNTSMFVLPEHKNLRWLTRLSSRGFAVSTGSACSSGKDNPSRVMQAMGCSFEEMGRVLRISALPETTMEDWNALLEALVETGQELSNKSSPDSAGARKIALGDL